MRASQPMPPIQGTRLPKLIGYDTTGIQAYIGLEQELFLASCDAHMRRPDLQMMGRIVIGKDAPHGQEMRDRYMAPPSSSSSNLALNYMRQIQNQCCRMGIPFAKASPRRCPQTVRACATTSWKYNHAGRSNCHRHAGDRRDCSQASFGSTAARKAFQQHHRIRLSQQLPCRQRFM